jgi:DNA-binding response OmpR family regulator
MGRILLVDDDESSRGVLEALLKYEGHEIALAANARQALFMIAERAPDLVLSDIQMPGMTGIDFCRELRKDPATRETYVILATGFDTPEARTLGIAAGADDYIGKPIRSDELNARVRLALRLRGLAREAADLRKRIAEGEKVRMELEGVRSGVARLRGDLTEALGSAVDSARRAAESVRQGDAKISFERAEKVVAEIEALRDRVAPRKPT